MATTTKFSPTPNRSLSQYSQSANLYTKRSPLTFSPYHATILRDNFTVPTWLLLGCLLQYTLTLLLRPSLAILPILLLIAYCLLKTLLQTLGLTKNPWSTGVISGRVAAAFPGPDERTAVSCPAQNGPGAIMILGARSHSPLGMFAPGFREISTRFNRMIRQLESTDTTGFMSASTWISTERTASNEVATLSYWRSIEDIHAFALSAVHREAWEWWNKGDFAHLGIMHEIFEIPKQGGWEGVYVNYSRTGLEAVTRRVAKAGEWVVPIVEAKGSWASSLGRLGSGAGDEKVKVKGDSGAVQTSEN